MNQLDSTTKKLKYFNSNCFLVENFKWQLFVFLSIVSQFIYFSYNGGWPFTEQPTFSLAQEIWLLHITSFQNATHQNGIGYFLNETKQL